MSTALEAASTATDLQIEALTLAADNRPMPASITRRTLNSLVRRQWMTQDKSGAYWITQAGRDVVVAANPIPDVDSTSASASTRSRAPKKERVQSACNCGCGKMTGAAYLPGHDARHCSILINRALEGEDLDEMIEAEMWDRPLLESKTREALRRKALKVVNK